MLCVKCLKQRSISLILLIILGTIGFIRFNEENFSFSGTNLVHLFFLLAILGNLILDLYFIFRCKNSDHGR